MLRCVEGNNNLMMLAVQTQQQQQHQQPARDPLLLFCIGNVLLFSI